MTGSKCTTATLDGMFEREMQPLSFRGHRRYRNPDNVAMLHSGGKCAAIHAHLLGGMRAVHYQVLSATDKAHRLCCRVMYALCTSTE